MRFPRIFAFGEHIEHCRSSCLDWCGRYTRGGAVAMNIESGDTPLVLLCPAWTKWGSATTVKKNTTILHSKGDDVVPFEDSGP